MNVLFEELAEQAKQEVWGTNPHNGAPEFEGYEIDYEKFAELIVKECTELTLDYKNEQHYSGWLDYRDEIKKHFGIKE